MTLEEVLYLQHITSKGGSGDGTGTISTNVVNNKLVNISVISVDLVEEESE